MNLVKWFRKNNKKLMAVVVIVIMVGFMGGAYLRQLGLKRTGLHKTVAYFGLKGEITNNDLTLARRELEILKMLQIDTMLRSMIMPISRTQDLRSLLLGELPALQTPDQNRLIGEIDHRARPEGREQLALAQFSCGRDLPTHCRFPPPGDRPGFGATGSPWAPRPEDCGAS